MSGKGKIAIAALAVAVLAGAGLAVLVVSGSHAAYTPMTARSTSQELLTQAIPDSTSNAEQLRRGQYLLRIGDCTSCHTRENGPFLAGSYRLQTPFGIIYSANITPDRETGIGDMNADQFYAVLHDGKGRHGENIYPAMPYTYMTRVTRSDSDAIFAYLKTVPAVKLQKPENELPFPFSVRALVSAWNFLFFSSGEFQSDPSKSAEWNRGAYLVTGPGHCGACHTPKNALAGDKVNAPLQGGTLDNWVSPDLTSNMRTGLGRWNVDDIVAYLKTGRSVHANAGGSMAPVVTYSTSLLSDADLHAMAVYLKDVPASPDAQTEMADAGAMKRGAAIYSDVCTPCHLEEAKGQAQIFPPLRDNAALQQADPTGLLHMILAGDRTAVTVTRPTPLTMPSFAWKLTDREVADVATYVRNSWGNRAAPVTEKQAADMRARLGLNTAGATGNTSGE